MRALRLLTPLAVLALVAGGVTTARAGVVTAPAHVEGTLASGATYVMDVPARWNGTVVLYSHGYRPAGSPNPAENAPGDGTRDALLADGYALVGSSYAVTGWALEEAVPDQLATLAEFTDRFGRARRTLAWGTSMGGMITTALAERHGHRFAGALAMCGLQQGGVANWNNTLDPVFAVRTLLAPGSDVPLVRLPDQATAMASLGVLTDAINAAQQTPLGRARIALAAALHNIPAWTDPAQPEPAPGDDDTAQLNQYRTLLGTTYVGLSWRQQAETRAGGNMSWNTGVDYGRMLARSSVRDEVLRLYAKAGTTPAADLRALARAPRITADPGAVRYMARHVSFTGRPATPLLTIHTTGDALVPVQVQAAYADAVRRAGREPLLRQAFVHRAGHCTFTDAEMLAAFRTMERRAVTGRWSGTDPASLNRLATAIDPASAPAYLRYRPAPYPRPFDLAPRR
jgi:pimeloyl-ACP methyl ester carboxylesterase